MPNPLSRQRENIDHFGLLPVRNGLSSFHLIFLFSVGSSKTKEVFVRGIWPGKRLVETFLKVPNFT